MSKRARSLSRLALILGVLAAVACTAEKRGSGDPAMVAQVQAQAERLWQGTGGHGFICASTSDGGMACVCKEDAPIGDANTCIGMEKVCDWLGRASLCNPSTGWCGCHGKPGTGR
jgi:hypothetical protein